jgi:hypothetical protein
MARLDSTPGSYTLGNSELFSRLGGQNGLPSRQRIAPEMRFGRPVNIQRDGGINSLILNEWHDFIDTLGQENYGAGKATALGSLVVTHVNAVEMGRMLGRKYPDLFNDRPNFKNILRAYRSIKSDYVDYVRGRDKEMAEIQCLAVEGDQASQEDYDRNAKLWGVAGFALDRQPDNFGKCDYSIVFTHDDRVVLQEEMHDTWQFLRGQGFDTSQIDRARKPHLSVFDSYHPLGSVGLKDVAIPEQIVLMPPTAFVRSNAPSITV